MYFDYAILAFMLWGIGDALFGVDDISDDSDAEPETETETDTDTSTDGGDLLDETDADSTNNDDADIQEDYLYVGGTTTVTVETDGETSTSTFEDVDFGIAPTISGSEERDIITASDETGMELQIEAGAGDDFISFGYGASVDAGEGVDVMALTVTQNALASDSDTGQIDMTDTSDTLAVTFEEETPEFVHTVRGTTTEVNDGVTTQTDWVDYYVSDNADLDADDLTAADGYEAADATRVFRAILGSGSDVDPVVNDSPAITTNRELASAIDLR